MKVVKRAFPLFVMLSFLGVLIGNVSPGYTADSASARVIVKDTTGRSVVIPAQPKRIVSLNDDASDLICAFGAGDQLIGVSDVCNFPSILKDKAKVCQAATPDLKKITAAKPDLVIAGTALKKEVLADLQRSGVPVFLFDCRKFESMARNIEMLGCIVGKESEAKEYASFISKYLNLIKQSTKNLSFSDKPRVYLESDKDYVTFGSRSEGAGIIEMAGGLNVAADQSAVAPVVNSSWVLAKNPRVIVKSVGNSPDGGVSEDALKKKKDGIVARAEWKNIAAVKNDRVYLLTCDVCNGPRAVIGLSHLAKWLHPDLFKDLDPGALSQEISEKFYSQEVKVAWVHPSGQPLKQPVSGQSAEPSGKTGAAGKQAGKLVQGAQSKE